jgi:hypothetical protein
MAASNSSAWVERTDAARPENGEQVFAVLQGRNRANDKVTVTRYVAGQDRFVGEDPLNRVVRWMPIPPTGRRARVNWKQWEAACAERGITL